jgi:hypothetical protein
MERDKERFCADIVYTTNTVLSHNAIVQGISVQFRICAVL